MSFWDYSGPERRKFKRFHKFFVVSLCPQADKYNSPSWKIIGLENISEAGALFNDSEKIEEGTLLDLRVKIFSDKNPIQCDAQVVHARKLGDLPLYEHGINFTRIKPEEQALIRQALEL